MLSQQILNSLKSYTESMQKSVSFVLKTGDHHKREELHAFLADIASISDNIELQERDDKRLRSPVSFLLEANGKDTGIRFSGIPSGHEFNSLILAVLQAAGADLKLDEFIQQRIKKIEQPLRFEVFVSLSCHNCPDLVQTLNRFALLNDKIETEMIDGGLYPDLIEQHDIQGVPSVYLNGTLFASGKVDSATLVDRLTAMFPELTASLIRSKLPTQDVTIVGGGPAGVSAAIYSARKGLKVTMVAETFGGQVKDTMSIENLIASPNTTGAEVVSNMTAHLSDYAITRREHVRVDSISTGDVKTVTLSSGEQIKTKTLIIATGARWRKLGIPGERENVGNGVAYCPHCDGPFFQGKDVAVIGGGNSGIEAALDLAGIVKSVTVFEFMPTLKADEVLVQQAAKQENINILTNVETQKIVASNGKVSGVNYVNRTTKENHQVALNGVFVQIGLQPNSQFAQGVVELTPSGEIIIDNKCHTSQPGIFACGDVTTVPYKQIVVSMGEGAKAALAAFEHLLTQKSNNETAEAA